MVGVEAEVVVGVEAALLLGAAVLAGVEGALLLGASVVVPAEAVGATPVTMVVTIASRRELCEVKMGGQPDNHFVQLLTIGRKAAVRDKSQPLDMQAPTHCKADRPDVERAAGAVPGGASAGAGSGAPAGSAAVMGASVVKTGVETVLVLVGAAVMLPEGVGAALLVVAGDAAHTHTSLRALHVQQPGGAFSNRQAGLGDATDVCSRSTLSG